MLESKDALGRHALYEKSRWADLDLDEYGQLKAQMIAMYNRADELETERQAAGRLGS
jgi:hypothetical protein